MSDYSEFFLSSPRSVVQLQLLEISHPSFTQTYYLVRNARNGVTVTHEDASVHDYTYLPMRITQSDSRDDLDAGINVQFGDLGVILPNELDQVYLDDTYQTPPVVRYRVYRSDDLTQPLYGPLVLQIRSISQDHEGAAFEGKAPRLNLNRTGRLYTVAEFPTVRGFL